MDELTNAIRNDFEKHRINFGTGLSANDKEIIFKYHTIHLRGYDQSEEQADLLFQLQKRFKIYS